MFLPRLWGRISDLFLPRLWGRFSDLFLPRLWGRFSDLLLPRLWGRFLTCFYLDYGGDVPLELTKHVERDVKLENSIPALLPAGSVPGSSSPYENYSFFSHFTLHFDRLIFIQELASLVNVFDHVLFKLYFHTK